MNHLRAIAKAVAAYEARPSCWKKRDVARAYRRAADAIKRTKRRPDRPVISDVTPEWFRGVRTEAA